MRFLRSKKHSEDIKRAQREAEEARESAEATKEEWRDVHRAAKKSRELREANGWTESIIDIFGSRL